MDQEILESRIRSTIMDKEPVSLFVVKAILKDATLAKVRKGINNLLSRGVIEPDGEYLWRIATK